jgi:arginase
MDIQIVAVPYDSGMKLARMGCGPGRLAQEGERVLQADGHTTRVDTIEVDDDFPTEVGTTFRLHRRVALKVKEAREAKHFPLVFAGNCGTASIGTVAGLSDTPTGVIWFDAHGDFNTPETTGSGFLDGMALSVITGRCWTMLAKSIPGFQVMPENRVIHAGGRDLDGRESEHMQSSNMCILTPERIKNAGIARAIKPGLDYISINCERVYLHIDMDILDPSEGRGNHFATDGGLKAAELLEAIDQIAERLPIVAAGIASYNPAGDEGQKALGVGLELMKRIASKGTV